MYACNAEDTIEVHAEDVLATLSIWEPARPDPRDGRVVETNLVMAYVYSSNTNAQLLGGEAALTAIAKYVVGYCAKNPVQLESVLSTIHHVLQEREIVAPHTDTKEGDDAETESHTKFLQRLINAMDRKVEISAQMAALSLMGYPSWHASHKFVVVHPWNYLSELRGLFPGDTDEWDSTLCNVERVTQQHANAVTNIH